MPINIIVVGHHTIIREGLCTILERDQDLKIVGEAGDRADALEKVRNLRPDVIVLEACLPDLDRITIISDIQREMNGTKVIVLASMLESSWMIRAIQAGAIGYLIQGAENAELCLAVKAAAAGLFHFSSSAFSSFLLVEQEREPSKLLTRREADILVLLTRGYSNKEIMHTLHIAVDTVKTHIRHILEKLQVQNRTEAVFVAMRLGLIDKVI